MAPAGLPEDGPKMRAAVYYDKMDIRIEEVCRPVCSENEVLVKVAYNGICGTDLHEWHDGAVYPIDGANLANWCTDFGAYLFDAPRTANIHPKPGCPHPVSGLTLPLVIGHEFGGTIEEVGSALQGKYKAGQKICAQPDFGCGACDLCKNGNRNVCTQMGFVGLSGPPGGLGQYTTLKPENFHVVPDDMGLDVAAMIEPLAVAWHATKIAKVKEGDTCLVIGSGPIGAFTIRSLKAQNVGLIICAEPAKSRQKIAKASGADHILNPMEQDVPEECRKLTGGKGVDVAFDAAGLANGATLDTAIKATRSLGQITNIAIYAAKVPIDLHSLYMGEKKLNGIIGYTAQDFKDVIKAVSEGRIKCEDLCTAKIPLDKLVQGGFQELIDNKDTHIKILVEH